MFRTAKSTEQIKSRTAFTEPCQFCYVNMNNWNITQVRNCGQAIDLFKEFGYEAHDYENFVIDNRYIICFVWDTRQVTKVIDMQEALQSGNINAFMLGLKLEQIKECKDTKTALIGDVPDSCKLLLMTVKCNVTLQHKISGWSDKPSADLVMNNEIVGSIAYSETDKAYKLKFKSLTFKNDFKSVYEAYDKLCTSWQYIVDNYGEQLQLCTISHNK